MRKKEKELQEKISEAGRLRKMAVLGLIGGVLLAVLGQLLQSPPFYIIGYTVFLVCTSITSFLTISIWLHGKTLRAELEIEKEPPVYFCPRCNARVQTKTRFCPKCGKKMGTKH